MRTLHSFLIFFILCVADLQASSPREELAKSLYWDLSSHGKATYSKLRDAPWSLEDVIKDDPAIQADFQRKSTAVGHLYASLVPTVVQEAETKYGISFLTPHAQLPNYFTNRMQNVLLPYHRERKMPHHAAEQRAAAVFDGMCIPPDVRTMDVNFKRDYQHLISQIEENTFPTRSAVPTLKQAKNTPITPQQWNEILSKLHAQIYNEEQASLRAFSMFFKDHPELFTDIPPHRAHEAIVGFGSFNHITSYLYKFEENPPRLSAQNIAKRDLFIQLLSYKRSALISFWRTMHEIKINKPLTIDHLIKMIKRRISEAHLMRWPDLKFWTNIVHDPEEFHNKYNQYLVLTDRRIIALDGLIQSENYWVDREATVKAIEKRSLPANAQQANQKKPRNMSLKEEAQDRKIVHYRIKRASSTVPLFLEMSSTHSPNLVPYALPTSTMPSTTQLSTSSFNFKNGDKNRFALATPDGEQLASIHLEETRPSFWKRLWKWKKAPTKKLELGKDYRIFQNSNTGKFVVELINPEYANVKLSLKVDFQPISEPFPEIQEKHYILDHNLPKLNSLTKKLREAGFIQLADGLDQHIKENLTLQKPITLDSVLEVFQKNSYYTYLPEGIPLPKHPTNPFYQWAHFLVDGKFHGQCNSADELAQAFLAEYYSGDPDIRVELRSGYLHQGEKTITQAAFHRQAVITDQGRPVYVFDSTPITLDPRVKLSSRIRARISAWLWNATRKKEIHPAIGENFYPQKAQPSPVKIEKIPPPSERKIAQELLQKRQAIFNEVRSLKMRQLPPDEPLPRMMKLTRVAAQVLDGTMKVKEANEELSVVFPDSPPGCQIRKCILEFVVGKSQEVYEQQEKIIRGLAKEMRKTSRKQAPPPKARAKFVEYTFAAQHPIREAHQYIQHELRAALHHADFLMEVPTALNATPVPASCARTIEAFMVQTGL